MTHLRLPAARRAAPGAMVVATAIDTARGLFGPGLLALLALGAVALLSLPAARGYSAGVGWTPLWLLALPASAWIALWLGRRGDRAAHDPAAVATPRRRRGPAAVAVAGRRRVVAAARTGGRRAA